MSIQTVKQREALKPRREPYWDRLANGQHLGYRRTESGGTWIAKLRDPATGERSMKALGDLPGVDSKDQYDAAVKLARKWFEHIGHGGTNNKITFLDVCHQYVQELKDQGRTTTAQDTERRFNQYVHPNKQLCGTDITKLTEMQVKSWRRWLRDLPTPSGGKRTASGLNRDMVCVRAALNLALRNKVVTTDAAWLTALEPAKRADKRRTVYPTRDEIKRIIERADPELATFLRALASVPVRPGALAELRVKNFNQFTNELTIPTDKAGQNRTIKLPAVTAALFKTTDKTPDAFIFTRYGGQWNKDKWKLPVKVAAIAAGVHVIDREPVSIDPAKRMSKARTGLKASGKDTAISIYSFRHAAVTTLIEEGLPIQSIANLAGTSPRMIHNNYSHLTDETTVTALERLAV